MKFTVTKEELLRPLQLISGVVERRQTMPILSNVLLQNSNNELTLTATDLEVEIVAKTFLDKSVSEGATTVPIKKFLDSCRTLPEEAKLQFESKDDKVLLRSGKIRFTLSTLPADEFPSVETSQQLFTFDIPQNKLKTLIDKTHFAMAIQDVRFYLNGLLLELSNNQVRTVATDGHRLAMCTMPGDFQLTDPLKIIIPRKAVIELTRLLEEAEDKATISIGNNYIQIKLTDSIFTSKLIDGEYPNYKMVIPPGEGDYIVADKLALRQCLIRASVLSNEKYRGIRIEIKDNKLKAVAINPEHEEAEDELAVEFSGDKLKIGFNVSYLVDAINAISDDTVNIKIASANKCALISQEQGEDCLYVVMPMRL